MVFGAGWKTLAGHVPPAVKNLVSTGRLPATNVMRLALGVPMRDPAGLQNFLAQVYDPASPNYRQFLTPEEITTRFGPTVADYQAVQDFARTNGLKITATHANRLLLDVAGQTTDVEKAFHFKILKFKHPTEAREFFTPDMEPTVDAGLPMADIQGLSDYTRPHPQNHQMNPTGGATPKNGSGSGSTYLGNDFRNAYASGTMLTGAGQMVGLLQLDDYYASDIAAYATAAGGGRSSIVIQRVVRPGDTVSPGINGGNSEVSLDIEMAMAMAPGLAKIVVFEASSSAYVNDILNMMAASNTVKNLSCSWGWGGGPDTTTDSIFQIMAAQGQSFFNASGDSDAFVAGSNNDVDNASQANAPSSSPYITQVGGTVLTMNGTGASFASETNWNDNYVNPNGGYWGSSGGVSTYYSLPLWQTNISMTVNKGSTTRRNIPDVAMTAANCYVRYGNGSVGTFGGTSCAAPLWAGFMALVNQQALASGMPSPGFINPAVYAIGKGSNANYSYAACFHDTTIGNNYWPTSPAKFPAATGYDLCTGWGTPAGTNLINALAGTTDSLGITPASGFAAMGVAGGPFTGAPQSFTLTNSSASSLSWSLINTSAWISVSNSSGTLAAGKQTNVTASLTSAANSLALGTYTATAYFSNLTTHAVTPRTFSLQVSLALVLSPTNGFTASGPVGGSFSISAQNYMLTNLSATALNWGIVNTSAWLTASPPSGSLAGGANTGLNIALNNAANALPSGTYTASVLVTNQGTIPANLAFTLQIGQSLAQNGGFETGDFTGWTQTGNTAYTSVASGNASYVHSGTFGVQAGPSGSLGYLSQVLQTTPGQSYLLSFWLSNPTAGSGEKFQANWNTNANTTNTIYSLSNPSAPLAWSNLTFVVTASGTTTTLQFGVQNDSYYFGFDDVSVTPIPIPTFTSFSRKTNALTLVWNSLAGVAYQVQYKTNLLQANWINLATNTATTNVIRYTNNPGTDLRRFYRIHRLP